MERFWENITDLSLPYKIHWADFHLWKIRVCFWYLPRRWFTQRSENTMDGAWFPTTPDSLLFSFFFKKNVIFLLIPLPSVSFNGIKRQINLSKSLGWLQGYLFALSGSPWKLQAGCAISVQTLSEVGNPHVWGVDSLCGGKSTSSSITNTCLVNKGQVKRPWDYMDYGTWLHRLTRQLKAAGIINILPRGAAIGL